MLQSAAIVCTKDRPEALSRTVSSIHRHGQETLRLLMVVDASDPQTVDQNKVRLSQVSDPKTVHVSYSGLPSSARQRNLGIDRLPSDMDLVFFLDDDVTVQPEYFDRIIDLFRQNPDVQGIGGFDVTHDSLPPYSIRRLLRYLFLLDHPRPGRILPSGNASPPQRTTSEHPVPVDWLPGFSMTLRRDVLETERFSPALDRYSYYEDCDLTVRVRKHGPLLSHPNARLAHRRSPKSRHDARDFQHSLLAHLYWFMEKNVEHPLKKPAFWWSTLGRLLAVLFSTKSQKWKALSGLLKGIRTIWTRSHPLLESS